ncbi:hypothetical protein EJ419_01330 [Alloscardovia theropitheci]|uniref:Uncharacterized protein n=1 Tax=Alloscardovia theropitheci TaxID=2496842 RepID=A0A4R0QYC6_9BIFI|nr:hypothetical protein [Alloscardovia theropitheci]TCD54770.1 hypothetical protein EJ419_01330 [Alloscardovia theropitheci]
MKTTRSFNVIVSVFIAFSMLTGCSKAVERTLLGGREDGYSVAYNVDGAALNGKKVDLSQVVAIIPLYEIANSSAYAKDRSQLVFVFKDGSYKIQDNHYMFLKQIAWTDKGVFYSDRKNDYFIDATTNIIHVTKHEKTDFEYTTYALDDTHSMTMYNKGLGVKNDGILSVASSHGDFQEITYDTGDHSGLGDNVALCENGNSYEVSNNSWTTHRDTTVMYQLSEKHMPVYKKVQEITRVSARDFENSSDILAITHNDPAIEIHGEGSHTTVCKDNWIYSTIQIGHDLTSYLNMPKGFPLGILKWNAVTGEHIIIVLRDEEGNLLRTPYGDQWNCIQQSRGSLYRNSFIIMSCDSGTIADVDLSTGKTREIITGLVPKEKMPAGRFYLECTDKYVYRSWIPINDNLGKQSSITKYSRYTKAVMEKINIDDKFTQYEQTDTVQPGYVAFNPKLLK